MTACPGSDGATDHRYGNRVDGLVAKQRDAAATGERIGGVG